MKLVKEEFGDGRVGVGMTGVAHEEGVDDDEDEGDEDVEVLPRMSSM